MSWIIDPRVGLISCVVADDPVTGKPSTKLVMLRARRRQHLENLRRLCPMLGGTEITAVRRELDYPVRMVVDRETFVAVMAELARTIDYRNVKQSAHQHEADIGADFVALMHRVHALLAQIGD